MPHNGGMVRLTRHAQERIEGRLRNLVSRHEVEAAAGRPLNVGKTYVQVKRVPYTEIQDPCVRPDGIARGDSIVASVVADGRDHTVVTVMLRKSWSTWSQ